MEIKSGVNYPFEKHSLNLIGALLQKSKTNQVDFILKSNLVFNTTNRTISSITASLNDLNDWKTILTDKSFQLNFTKMEIKLSISK